MKLYVQILCDFFVFFHGYHGIRAAGEDREGHKGARGGEAESAGRDCGAGKAAARTQGGRGQGPPGGEGGGAVGELGGRGARGGWSGTAAREGLRVRVGDGPLTGGVLREVPPRETGELRGMGGNRHGRARRFGAAPEGTGRRRGQAWRPSESDEAGKHRGADEWSCGWTRRATVHPWEARGMPVRPAGSLRKTDLRYQTRRRYLDRRRGGTCAPAA